MTLAPIQVRRDNKINWETVNPVLAPGEPGYSLDTHELKIGDGGTPWVGLPTIVTVPDVADLEFMVDLLGNLS